MKGAPSPNALQRTAPGITARSLTLALWGLISLVAQAQIEVVDVSETINRLKREAHAILICDSDAYNPDVVRMVAATAISGKSAVGRTIEALEKGVRPKTRELTMRGIFCYQVFVNQQREVIGVTSIALSGGLVILMEGERKGDGFLLRRNYGKGIRVVRCREYAKAIYDHLAATKSLFLVEQQRTSKQDYDRELEDLLLQ